MYNHFQLGLKYLGYLFSASNGRGHGVHSPFVFELIEQVLLPAKQKQSKFEHIEEIRRKYISDSNSFIDVKDLGAGSFSKAGARRSVSQIAAGAAKNPKFARLLFHLVTHFKIDHVLELGTSLGLTTRYLALSGTSVHVQTIEGAPSIAAFTRNALEQEGYTNIELLVGDFIDKLPHAISKMKGRKLFFLDGNHQYVPTVEYFKMILDNCDANDILVFDDIHWSEGMEKAWEEIKNNERVSCSVDLFFVGIVFLRKEFKEKLNYTIRF